MKISVCIPCYNRPYLAKEAIESVLNQDPKPFEILIGDDSKNDETEQMVNSIDSGLVKIRYWHNKPGLGQAINVQTLFEQAEGDLITLLHDDDKFRPNAFSTLTKPFFEQPQIVVTFGKQVIISEQGIEDVKATEALNIEYNRIAERTGLIKNSIEAGALSMIPNNCYFVRKEIAQSINYVADGKAGDACDFYFGFRLGLKNKPIYFCNEFTSDYRITPDSIARGGRSDAGFRAFKILMDELKSIHISASVDRHLRSKVKVAIFQGITHDRKLAFKWYFSRWHRSSILSLGGMRRLLLLLKIL